MKKIGTFAPRASNQIHASKIGIGFECIERKMWDDTEELYRAAGELGVKHARVMTGWFRCEREKGVYDFEWLEKIVNKLLAQGIRPWFCVCYGNKLYCDSPADDAAGYPPLFSEEARNAWTRYATELATRFRGRVTHFEVWNEPNCSGFWKKGPDYGEYVDLVRITSNAIRACNPEAKIIGGASGMSIALWNGHLDVYEYIRKGICPLIDVFTFHRYHILPELHRPEDVRMLRAMFDENGGKHVELWQGECGFASWFPENHWLPPYVRESERNQAAWLLRRYVADFAAGISLSSFFQTVDMMLKDYKLGNETRKQPARHGILNGITYTEKLSFHAMRHIANIFSSPMPLRGGGAFCAVSLDRAFPRSERHSRLMDAAVFKAVFEKNSYPVFVYYLAEDVQYGFPGIGKQYNTHSRIRQRRFRKKLSAFFPSFRRGGGMRIF